MVAAVREATPQSAVPAIVTPGYGQLGSEWQGFSQNKGQPTASFPAVEPKPAEIGRSLQPDPHEGEGSGQRRAAPWWQALRRVVTHR